jgi:predicted RNA binding protein with dsRBD fold (UPF0201 family)
MIYKDHNFTENFCNAIGYKDEGMMKDIILDELSRLIVDEKTDVVKLLRDNDINVSVKDNDIVIANIITNEISKDNDKVTKGISDLITKSRFNTESYKSFSGKILSADAGKGAKFLDNVSKVLSNPVVQDSVSTVTALGLKKAFNKKNSTTASQNSANLLERLKMNQASNTKKKINIKVILIILGVTTIIGILGIKLYKSRQTSVS